MVSNISAAMLDTPMSEFITALQKSFGQTAGDSYVISAHVHWIVTSNNDTAETLRDGPAFWNPYDMSVLTKTASIGHKIFVLINKMITTTPPDAFRNSIQLPTMISVKQRNPHVGPIALGSIPSGGAVNATGHLAGRKLNSSA